MEFGTIDFDYGTHLATVDEDADGPIWMVNFMRYREKAIYADGRESDISGREADDIYAPVDVLQKLGADVAYFGDVTSELNAPTPFWHRIGIVRYPTRRSFIAMQNRPDFVPRMIHKEAGMEFTIIACCLPTSMVELTERDQQPVTFALVHAGEPAPTLQKGEALFSVEGTIIGDERRWDHLVVSWGEEPIAVPAGSIVVESRPLIDEIRRVNNLSLS
jgi:hypothetical protein